RRADANVSAISVFARELLDARFIRLLAPAVREVGIDMHAQADLLVDDVEVDDELGFCREPFLAEEAQQPHARICSAGLRALFVDPATASARPTMRTPFIAFFPG